MPHFRKKPVVIEAMQWDGTAANATTIISWILGNDGTATYRCSDPERCAEHDGDAPHSISIHTLEGTVTASIGDWILKGVQGEFYPCKPDIFASTYEPAEVSTTDDQRRADIADSVTTHTKELLERRTTTLRQRAEQAEAGRIAADNMLRAVCDVFGGPHKDPAVEARKALTRAERAERAETERDGAYRERAQLLAWLAALQPAVRTLAPDTTEPGWQILYLNPNLGGQLSWHIAPQDVELFDHVEYVPTGDPRATWDGHTTEAKYERIASLTGHLADLAEATGSLPCACTFDSRCPNCRTEGTTSAADAIDRVRDRCQAIRDRVGPGGMINASQILGLLSPTWPDGNYEAVEGA